MSLAYLLSIKKQANNIQTDLNQQKNRQALDAAGARAALATLNQDLSGAKSKFSSDLTTNVTPLKQSVQVLDILTQNLDRKVQETASNTNKLKQDIASKTQDLLNKNHEVLNRFSLVDQTIKSTDVKLRDLNNKIPKLDQSTMKMILSQKSELENRIRQRESEIQALTVRSSDDRRKSQRMFEAMGGNIVFWDNGVGDEEISAAELNAAAAGAFTKTFTLMLASKFTVDEEDIYHTQDFWDFAPVVSGAETVADEDVAFAYNAGDPEAGQIQWGLHPDQAPAFFKGGLQLQIVFDTDAGVSKTYVADETLTVTVKVSSDDTLLGHTVTEFTKTYTVVA